MPNYTKLFNCIVTSTIWQEDDSTRIVWITLLALSDQNGEIHASIPGLARLAGQSIEDTEKAIEKLMSPDPYSRTPDFEGRRIGDIPGGWEILNHDKYRKLASVEDRREAAAERQRRRRKRERGKGGSEINLNQMRGNSEDDHDHDQAESEESPSPVTQTVTRQGDSHASVTPSPYIAEAEAETEKKKKKTDSVSLPFGSDEFSSAWEAWETHRKEKRNRLTPSTRKSQLKKLGEMSEQDAIATIEQSIRQGWVGLFDPPGSNSKQKGINGVSAKQMRI